MLMYLTCHEVVNSWRYLEKTKNAREKRSSYFLAWARGGKFDDGERHIFSLFSRFSFYPARLTTSKVHKLHLFPSSSDWKMYSMKFILLLLALVVLVTAKKTSLRSKVKKETKRKSCCVIWTIWSHSIEQQRSIIHHGEWIDADID